MCFWLVRLNGNRQVIGVLRGFDQVSIECVYVCCCLWVGVVEEANQRQRKKRHKILKALENVRLTPLFVCRCSLWTLCWRMLLKIKAHKANFPFPTWLSFVAIALLWWYENRNFAVCVFSLKPLLFYNVIFNFQFSGTFGSDCR